MAKKKRRKPPVIRGAQSKSAILTLQVAVQKGLDLMGLDEAEAIIGEPTEEYKILDEATRAIYALAWATMRQFGLRHNKRSLKMMSQSMIVAGVLFHQVYALGIRQGESRSLSEGSPKG